jgi:hypothetical protein
VIPDAMRVGAPGLVGEWRGVGGVAVRMSGASLTEAAGELETAAALAPTEGERRLVLSRLLDARPEPA